MERPRSVASPAIALFLALILGAGIAGLTAAYELKGAGYRVTMLEAKSRAGGS